MNYALTIKDNMITGVHEGMDVFSEKTFEKNAVLADHKVVPIPDRLEYMTGIDYRCYEPDGTLKPLLWCVENGYSPLPPNTEIIDGEVVSIYVPEAEAPKTLMQEIMMLRAQVAELATMKADISELKVKVGKNEPSCTNEITLNGIK